MWVPLVDGYKFIINFKIIKTDRWQNKPESVQSIPHILRLSVLSPISLPSHMRSASDGSLQASLRLPDCRAGRLVFQRAGRAYAGSDEWFLEPTENTHTQSSATKTVQLQDKSFTVKSGDYFTGQSQRSLGNLCINKRLANIVLLIRNRSISLSWLSIHLFLLWKAKEWYNSKICTILRLDQHQTA